jgi:hypothetical protein
MNTKAFNIVFAFNIILVIGLLCSGCTSSPRGEEVKENASQSVQRFDAAADNAGKNIKSSIDQFGNNVGTAVNGKGGDELKTNAAHAMSTVGTDVEIAGHAISNKIEGLGNDLHSVDHSHPAGGSFEESVDGFAHNANNALKPMENSLSKFGKESSAKIKTATKGHEAH